MSSLHLAALAVVIAAGTALADPPAPAPPALDPIQAVLPGLIAAPAVPPPSLRIEAARVVAERFEDNWRFPAPGAVVGLDGGGWFVGAGYYRPRSPRSAALGAGSVAASIVGEILMSAGSPLAGLGALVTGATLDAAAADVDRDAEGRRPR